ncbi:MAG: protein kinase domain-containing protein [Burkholderiales bacterium]
MPSPTQIGRYEIRTVLGRGGMATVWEAWDPVLQRMVALKAIEKSKLEPESSLKSLGRLKREAQAAARLVHPNIVGVYEFGEDENYAFIVMERVSGHPLSNYLHDEDFRSELPQVREIIAGILEALAYSHSEGVVHRDIKPSNILISRDGVVKVTDFGIARMEVGHSTVQGSVIGTPYYMSPEQYRGQHADWRTDIFSTGVIFYELLTGEKPFPGTTSAAVMHRVLSEEPLNPSVINTQLPKELDAVVLAALAKDFQERFQSAREFLQLIDAVLRRHSGQGSAREVSRQAPVIGDPQAPPPMDSQTTLGRASAGGNRLSAARRLSTTLQRGPSNRGPSATPAVSSESRIEPTLDQPLVRQPVEDVRPRILFVDDEERILTALRSVFRAHYQVVTCAHPAEAMVLIESSRFPVVVSDQRMPGMLGVDFLRKVRDISPATVRILLTGYSDLASMVGSINEGEVYRFISKPWDTQEILEVVAEAASIGNRLLQRGVTAALPPPITRDAVLVIDESRETYNAVAGFLEGAAEVVYARGITDALSVLQKRETAVVIADVDSGLDNYLVFLNVLKRERPEILVIALTSASDSEYVIQFINSAQIYRFLNKPVNLDLMEQYVRSAIVQHEAYRETPELLEQHSVNESQKAMESTVARWIKDGLRSLRGRLASGRPRL